MLPRVKGSDSSKVGELSMFDDKDPITWKFFFRIYLAQFMGYIEVIEMPIPEDESEEECAERINQYGKINGKLIAMIGGSCYKNPICRNLLRGYTGHQWAYYYLEFLMKRFKPKGEQRLGQLIVKFGQLTMTGTETISEFLDRIRDCIAEIRACDPSQVPTDEQTAIRAKAGIEFAFPHLYAALQVGQKMSLEDLFELMDAFTGKNQLVDEEKKTEPANFV